MLPLLCTGTVHLALLAGLPAMQRPPTASRGTTAVHDDLKPTAQAQQSASTRIPFAATDVKKRRVSYWFGPWATAPCPPPGPPPAPVPPGPPGCLPDCSWAPCMTCITGCPDPGGTPSGTEGHGCNISGHANTCSCNAMGGRPGGNCSQSSRGFTLCPGSPPINECRHNATYALAALKRQGGSSVATSVFLYCGHTINATGELSAPPYIHIPEGGTASSLKINMGCVEMASGLRSMGIGSEPVIGGSLPALRAMIASPQRSIDAISELVRTEQLAGVSWDVEPANSTTEDANKFAAYLGSLRGALAPLGARVTVYSNAFSQIIENISLLSTSSDRVLAGETYNGGLNSQASAGMSGWLENYGKLLAPGVNRDHVAPAMLASTLRGTWNCLNSSIEQRYRRIVADDLREIAIYTFDPTSWVTPDGSRSFTDCSNKWVPFLRRFLAGNDA